MLSPQENRSSIQRNGDPHNGFPRFFHDHFDRDEVKRRAQIDFLNLFDAYGGRRGRGKALFCLFHPDKNNPSASIHQGYFHCFACGVTYDPFDFVQELEHCDFRSALVILAARYGVELNRARTEAERRDYARKKAAEGEARQVMAYRRDMVNAILDELARSIGKQDRCLRVLLKRRADSPTARRASTLYGAYDRTITMLDAALERIRRASGRDLLRAFRNSGRARFAQPQEPNREIQHMTATVVAMLVRAQQRDGDVPSESEERQSAPSHEVHRIVELVDAYLPHISCHPAGGAQ